MDRFKTTPTKLPGRVVFELKGSARGSNLPSFRNSKHRRQQSKIVVVVRQLGATKRVEFGEHYPNWPSMAPCSAKAKLPEAAIPVLERIALEVPTKNFDSNHEWRIEVRETTITIQFSSPRSQKEFKDVVHRWIEDLWSCLLQQQKVLASAA